VDGLEIALVFVLAVSDSDVWAWVLLGGLMVAPAVVGELALRAGEHRVGIVLGGGLAMCGL
jgi:hypothetical protein